MRAALLLATLTLAATAQAQWTIQTPTTADLRGIDNVGKGIAWASGTNGTILRTTDTGTHWQLCTIPPNADHLDFRGIQAFDANTAIVMSSGPGDQSRLYKTTDACQTWTLQTSNSEKEGFWDAVVFQHGNYGYTIGDSQTAVLIGDPVNGRFQTEVMFLGHGWFIDNAGCASLSGEAAFAASNSSIFVFGSRRYILGTGGKAGASVLISPLMLNTSGSDPCIRVPVPIGNSSDSSGIFSLFFRDIDHGIAVGGDYTRPDESSRTAAWTSDMGRHWQAATTPPHGYRSAVAYDAPTKTWITVGPNGTDISTDDGRNWRALLPTPDEPPDAAQHWNALSLPYAVGPHGRIGILNPSALKPTSKTL
jgi:photosystem II stability/assembly factor-like uncharacterized protein